MHLLKINFADLFVFNRSAIDLTKPSLGMAIVLVALIMLSTVGPFGFTMAFGAVLAVAFDSGGSPRRRAITLIIFAVAGALATLLGNAAGLHMGGSIAVVFGVTLLCGLALAFDPRTGMLAFFINLWMMIALSLAGVLYAPLSLSLGFLCGSGLIALAVILSHRADATNTEASSPETTVPEAEPRRLSLAPLRSNLSLHSPVLRFALLRAVAAALAMWIGWLIAPGHPYWIAMTLLIVAVPDRAQAARTSWQRAIGTVIGVALGAAVLALNLPQITLLLLWLLVTLVMLAVQGVNYVLYASVLTLDLVLFYQLLEADVLFNGVERLLTTLLGIGLALGMLVVLELLDQQRGDAVGEFER